MNVIYPYSNSLRAVGIEDHDRRTYVDRAPKGTYDRCDYAGRTLIYDCKWSSGSGYTPEELPFLGDLHK